MSGSAFDKPPYFDWRIDRWKVGFIVLLFLALLIATFLDPQRDAGAGWTASGPLEPEAAVVPASPTQPSPAAEATSPHSTEAAEAFAPDDFSLPLTLASFGPNSVTSPGGLTTMSGTARPGNQVEVRSQHILQAAGDGTAGGASAVERRLGVAIADSRGLWTLAVADELEPGQHVLSLFETDDRGAIVDASSPIVITVLAPGEEGPPSLATPAVRFPTPAARLPSGRVSFVGSGLAGSRVRLFLDGRNVGESAVNAQEEWSITPDQDIAPGLYVARVAALDHRGEIIAESPPVAFAVLEAVENADPGSGRLTPSIPLAVTGATLRSGRRALALSGQATPHSAVSAWHEDAALRAVNAGIDGAWQMSLLSAVPVRETSFSVRTDLGEAVFPRFVELDGSPASFPPVLLSPRQGDVLEDGQPVFLGLAQPDSEISLRLNSSIVAMMVADPRGQWAYQPPEPLPSGEIAIAAYAGNALAQAVTASPTVYVTIVYRS